MSRGGRAFRGRRWSGPALLGAAVLIWVAAAAAGGLAFTDLLAGAAAVAAGLLLAPKLGWVRGLRARNRGPGRPAGRDDTADYAAPDHDPGPDPLRLLLLRLCPPLRAARLTLWERDAEAGVLRPLWSSHAAPHAVSAAGDPMVWALEQDQPLRLDRAPHWAVGHATAAPVRGRLVLTAESSEGSPHPEAVADAAAVVASFVELREREQRASAKAARLDRFLAFLKSLPAGAEAERLPDELARAIGEVAGADGALVASWDGERGRVLATWGTGGGPAPGTYFAIMQGELAFAARANGPIHRTPGGRPPVLAQAGERWSPVPKHLTAMPLQETAGRVRGVVAFWGHVRADAAVNELITAMAPLLALQLQHSGDLVHLRQRAHEDALTGLRNRAALDERLADERNRFHRYRRPASLLVLDLDHFKRINDTWGHAAGDAVLERVGALVAAAIRDADFAARYGGEELVVLLPETMCREAADVAERIRTAVAAAAVEWNGQRIPISASIGVSSCPEIVEDPADLLRSADEALYASKSGGRNRVTVAVAVTSGG